MLPEGNTVNKELALPVSLPSYSLIFRYKGDVLQIDFSKEIEFLVKADVII